MEIFGDLGNDGYHAMTGIVTAQQVMAKEESIILDSGASDHMFNNISDFSNYKPHNGKVEIGEVGRCVEIAGKGDIELTYENNTVTLCNVYHVPSLPYCLISQTALWNKGAQIIKTGGDNFEVRIKNRKIFSGKIKNRLPFPDLKRKNNICQISLEDHRNMGHNGSRDNCKACVLGK